MTSDSVTLQSLPTVEKVESPVLVPSIGRIVHYTLSEDDAKRINRRREHHMDEQRRRAKAAVEGIGSSPSGEQKHVGNRAAAGDVLPMLIVRCWGTTPGSSVNGQVFLDGNDSLWVTSVSEGEGQRRWVWPPRV